MKKLLVEDIESIISNNQKVLIQDRLSEEGRVFEGTVLQMGRKWYEREVKFIKTFMDGTLVLEIE